MDLVGEEPVQELLENRAEQVTSTGTGNGRTGFSHRLEKEARRGFKEGSDLCLHRHVVATV